MKKLNLQLFASLNTGTSVVDYLKSMGKDSSYSARKELAQGMGIANYTGTEAQNTQMLNRLKSGYSASTGPSSGSAGTAANSTTANSTTAGNAAAATPSDGGKLTAGSVALNGVDQGLVDVMNSRFAASDSYQEALKYTNSLLEQLSSGKTSYTDQVKELMGQIQGRDGFAYDAGSDMLFQQYLSSAMNSGKTAMQDTIGQAAALTGGYGSTYGTAAGNQAYNQYIQEAYNNLPEYYEMAMQAYQMEGDEMYRQLGMLNDADSTEYQRAYDAWNANYANTNNLYAQEYSKWADEVANAGNLAGLANSDWWNTKNYDESVRQYNLDQEYRYAALSQEQAQFEANMAANGYRKDADGNWVEEETGKATFTDEQLENALNVYQNKGDDALTGYIGSIGAENGWSEDTVANLYGAVVSGGTAGTAQAELTNWEAVDKGGVNWLGGMDRNAVIRDTATGKTYTASELKKLYMEQGMTASEARQAVIKAQKIAGVA